MISLIKTSFILLANRCNSRGIAPVFCRLSTGKLRKTFATGIFIPPKQWSKLSQRVLGTTPEEKLINNRLSDLEAQFTRIEKQLYDEGKTISLEAVYARFSGSEEEITLCRIYDEKLAKMELLTGREYTPATIQKFREVYGHLKAYLTESQKRPDIPLKQLDYNFIKRFEDHLLARNLKPITINKIIQRLRQIVGYAVKCGYIQRDPFADYKPLKEKKRLVYLTPEELQKLENYHFSQRRLEQVKNIYLFSVYTGLAYNEASQLQRKHLITGMDGKLWIEMVRQKTGREFAIPLLPQAAELLRILAPEEGDGFLLPRISNQKINSYLKEIGEIIGIDKRLTHHTARKTFATTVLLYNDVPIKVTTIRQIIAQLPDEIRSQCGILCSEASRQNAGEYYQELTANNTLSLRITFLTCAYFAGVDIAERFHLISISDATKIYTMLSTARLTQIAGRCRHPEGVFSETVIYSTKQYDFATSESLREFYLKMAQDLANYANDADTLQCKYPNTLPSDFLTIKESVVEKSRYKAFGESPVPLIRTNIEGTSVPAYMNIDAIYERLQLRLNLYSTLEKLPAALQEEGHTVTTQELLPPPYGRANTD